MSLSILCYSDPIRPFFFHTCFILLGLQVSGACPSCYWEKGRLDSVDGFVTWRGADKITLFNFSLLTMPTIYWRPWLSGYSGLSNNRKVGGYIPTLATQRLVNWQLEGWQSTSLPGPRCPWARHSTPMLPGRCDWLPTAPVYGICLYECVTLCMCVFNWCQPGWVKCRGEISCISLYMTINHIYNILFLFYL